MGEKSYTRPHDIANWNHEVEIERRHNIPLFTDTLFCPCGRDGRHIKDSNISNL